VTTALCPLGRIVADCRWHSKLQNKAQETKFLTLSCVKSLLREKSSVVDGSFVDRTAVNFHSDLLQRIHPTARKVAEQTRLCSHSTC
jgi:hypothetical protein